MSRRSLIIRAGAIGLCMVSGGVFALQSGLLPGIGNAQTAPVPVVLASLPAQAAPMAIAALSAADQTPVAPVAPSPTTTVDVALPAQAATAQRPAQQPVLLGITTPDVPPPLNSDNPMEEGLIAVSALGLPCGLTMTASAMPAAMVALDVIDPCQPMARVTLSHSGMTLTAQTDALGLLTIDIPAFETPAFFTAEMADGSTASTLVALPDMAGYERVGVQWQGDRGLQLHAMEFGAAFGEAGHIWQDMPGTMANVESGLSGALITLGDPTLSDPHVAQIYTFPRDTLRRDDAVRLSIDAPITAASCGQDTVARTLQTASDGSVVVTELSFTTPGCDAVGDYLVLQNLLRDLRLASN